MAAGTVQELNTTQCLPLQLWKEESGAGLPGQTREGRVPSGGPKRESASLPVQLPAASRVLRLPDLPLPGSSVGLG